MDLGTIIGLVLGFGLVIGSILLGGGLGAFLHGPSAMIVIGGTLATTLISERVGHVLGGFKVALNAFFSRGSNPDEIIKLVVELATAARKDGILALERVTISHKFLAKGVRLAVDGIAPEEIRATLGGELAFMKQRHKRGQKLFRSMAGAAPAMGMVGTLIGLVQMLKQLDDPSKIGPAMAIALLTTLYGGLIAFLICAPIAEKLEHRSTEESSNMSIVIEGVDAILRGENPRLIQDKLEAFLAPKLRSEKK